MDWFIRSLFTMAGFGERVKEISEERMTLLALGSYGRRELCFGSDVDLLIVYRGRFSPEMNKIVPRALYPLWDVKLELGHTVLTVQECLRLAKENFRFLTSLMDARFLMGSKGFYRLFDTVFWSKIQREKHPLFQQFLIHQQKREEKYATEDYFIEPDIKEGIGGLRDLHFMSWMARLYLMSRHPSQIKRFPVFSHFDITRLSHSKSFLLKVRNHLHVLAGQRKEDLLLLPFQKEISASLGYHDGRNHTGLERFMRSIHLHLNRIQYGYEEFLALTMDLIYPMPLEPAPKDLPSAFRVMKGNIVLTEEKLLQKEPLLILKAFNEANRRGLFLASGLIWEARKLIAADGKKLLLSPGAKRLFLDIILNPSNPKILRLALEIGLISLFVPQFNKIRNLAQFGYYHVETVDLHSLKTLEVIQKISMGYYDNRWPLFKEIFKQLEHPDYLFLTGFLHDIGKGYQGDHGKKGARIIPGILKRLGISGDALRMIPFLVRHHLLLVRISQRRDLNDEKSSVQVAQTIQNLEALKLLFLLTIADSISTGPMAHNDWRMMLLSELFFKVSHILERGTLASPDATKKLETVKRKLKKSLAPHFPPEDVLDLMDQVSARYYLNTPLEDIGAHFRLALAMGKEKLTWKLQKLKDAPVTRIVLCTYDRPGLFSKMVGVLALNNIDVLSARIFTLKNGLTFDIYETTNPLDPLREKEKWDKVRDEIRLAIEDQVSLDHLIRKKGQSLLDSGNYLNFKAKWVYINNEISDFFTVIEVSSGMKLGLLYDLAKRIFSLGLDIRFAKVNSDKEKMTGVFYLRDSGGQKIYGEDQIEKIKLEVLAVIN